MRCAKTGFHVYFVGKLGKFIVILVFVTYYFEMKCILQDRPQKGIVLTTTKCYHHSPRPRVSLACLGILDANGRSFLNKVHLILVCTTFSVAKWVLALIAASHHGVAVEKRLTES